MFNKKKVVVKRYETEKKYQKDMAKMIDRGYRVANVVIDQPKSGCLRWLTIGVFALIFKPKSEFVVTYRLDPLDEK